MTEEAQKALAEMTEWVDKRVLPNGEQVYLCPDCFQATSNAMNNQIILPLATEEELAQFLFWLKANKGFINPFGNDDRTEGGSRSK